MNVGGASKFFSDFTLHLLKFIQVVSESHNTHQTLHFLEQDGLNSELKKEADFSV